MKKFYRLHDYSENMKANISIFRLKGREKIFGEDVKHVRGIKIGDLKWHEFKRLFRKQNLSERYYDNKSKEVYELKMVFMIDEE